MQAFVKLATFCTIFPLHGKMRFRMFPYSPALKTPLIPSYDRNAWEILRKSSVLKTAREDEFPPNRPDLFCSHCALRERMEERMPKKCSLCIRLTIELTLSLSRGVIQTELQDFFPVHHIFGAMRKKWRFSERITEFFF